MYVCHGTIAKTKAGVKSGCGQHTSNGSDLFMPLPRLPRVTHQRFIYKK